MPESTLALAFDDLKARVGQFAGYTRTEANWSTEEAARIADWIKDGLRRFYMAREWTFLRPWLTLATVSGQWRYTMPEGVAYVVGDLYFTGDNAYCGVRLIDAETVLRYRQDSVATGVPDFGAIRPVISDGLTGQLNELIFYPTPSSVWTVTYQGRIVPDALTASAAYALGGDPHTQTILEACLAACDLGENDAIALHEAAYQRELARSIEYDARAYMPRSMGFMGNARRRMTTTLPPDLEIEFSS